MSQPTAEAPKYSIRIHEVSGRRTTIVTQSAKASSLIANWLLFETNASQGARGVIRVDMQEQHGPGRPFIRAVSRRT